MQEERGSFGLERLRDQFDQPRPWMAGPTRDRLRCSRVVGKGEQQLFWVITACRRNLSVVDAVRCAGEVQCGMMESQVRNRYSGGGRIRLIELHRGPCGSTPVY